MIFLLSGLAVAAWASLVPSAKAATGVNEAQLGLVLLCLGIGSILAMPVGGALATRFGCRAVLGISGLVLCGCLPVLAIVSSVAALAATLFVFGAMLGTFDCVMNIQAVIVERDSNRPLMSGFHGFYSLGGLLGAAATSSIMELGVSPLLSVTMIGALGLLLMLTTSLLPIGIIQANASIGVGLWWARSVEFLEQTPIIHTLRWVRTIGDFIFIGGAAAYLLQMAVGLMHTG